MRSVPLRNLVSKLVLLALSASAVTAGAAPSPIGQATIDDGEFAGDVAIDGLVLEPRGGQGAQPLDRRHAASMLGRSLAMALEALPKLEATHFATTWALSPIPLRRAAIAHALEWAFPLLGDAVVLDHLAGDSDPAIRAAVARAAWIRRATGGDDGVLARLGHDPDPDVRSIALGAR